MKKHMALFSFVLLITIFICSCSPSHAASMAVEHVEITTTETENNLWFTYKKDGPSDIMMMFYLHHLNQYEETVKSIASMRSFCDECFNLNLWSSCTMIGSQALDMMNWHFGETPAPEYQYYVFEITGNMGISYMNLGEPSKALPCLQQVLYMLHHWDNSANDNVRTPEEDIFIEWIFLYYEREAYLSENNDSQIKVIDDYIKANQAFQELYQQKDQFAARFEGYEPNPYVCYETLIEK